MKPKLVCANCSVDISHTDKFCPSCGTKVEWDGPTATDPQEKTETQQEPQRVQHTTCVVCGYRNEGGANYCESCGVRLESDSGEAFPKGKKTAGKSGRREGKKPYKRTPVSAATAISFTAGIILVGFAIYIFIIDRDAPHSHQLPPESGITEQAVMQEISRLEHILEHEPDDADVILQLANLYHDVRMLDRAISYYTRYKVLHPENPDARVDLGICFFEANMPERAVEEVRSVTEEFPQHQLAAFNLGIIFLNLGEIGQANRYFTRAAEINPDNETARRARRIIEEHSF